MQAYQLWTKPRPADGLAHSW